jgi:serine protease inhibitor ecotin
LSSLIQNPLGGLDALSHLTAMKHILRFLQGTLDHGLLICHASTLDLVVYTDVDRVGCPDTHRSTSSYTVFLGDNLISWSSMRQNVVSYSRTEVEYHALANGVAEACWLRQLLVELHSPLS